MASDGATRLRALAAAAVLASFLAPHTAWGQTSQHEHADHDHDHHHGMLHFSHPLVAESVTPDTKIRLNGVFSNHSAGSDDEMEVEAEYAFAPAFSIELGFTPYTYTSRTPSALPGATGRESFSELDIDLKFANFAFAEHGVLLGYGAGLAVPLRTGGEPVKALTSVEPFLNLGYQKAGWEVETFARFGIPTSGSDGVPANADLGTNLSLLRHVAERLQALLELDTTSPLGGGNDPVLANVTPGVKVQPLASNEHLILGAGLRLPVSHTKQFTNQALVSMFWHF